MPSTHGMKASEEQKMVAPNDAQMATNTTKLRGYLQVKHNPATRRSRLPRKVRIFPRVIYVLESSESLPPPYYFLHNESESQM